MKQLKKDLEEALEKINLLTEERDNLKDRYKDAKVYICKVKDEIDDLKFGKEPFVQTSDNDDTKNLKKENEILKHELKIGELKLNLKTSGSKSELDLTIENTNLKYQLSQVTFELDSINIEYVELEKYNIIVKGALTQEKEQLEKIYSSFEKIN